MKYLKQYDTEKKFLGDKENFKKLDKDYIVRTLDDNNVYFSREPFYGLVLTAVNDNTTVQLTRVGNPPQKALMYSINFGEWINWDLSSITLNKGDKLCLKSDNTIAFASSGSDYHQFVISNDVYASGNIMSLLNFSDTVPDWGLASLFYHCHTLLSPPDLPAMNLGIRAYYDLFDDCTKLSVAPELPAEILAESCYNSMLQMTNISKPPKLNSTHLAANCYMSMFYKCLNIVDMHDFEFVASEVPEGAYYGMFRGCSNLVSIPKSINATSVGVNGCRSLFHDCTSLTKGIELPATTLGDSCYHSLYYNCTSLTMAPDLPAMTMKPYCYCGMFNGCSSLTKAPKLPGTTLANYCYGSMFLNCSSLEKSPDLPALTLMSHCYEFMFYKCTMLNYVKAMFTTTPTGTGESYTKSWLDFTQMYGTFVKNANATWDVPGYHGIPTYWTIQTA